MADQDRRDVAKSCQAAETSLRRRALDPRVRLRFLSCAPKYFDDFVRVKLDAPPQLRPGEKAWIIMVNLPADRNGPYFDQFPPGVVYSVEFENGASIEVHKDRLEALI